jgi:hypothetical protein
MTARDDYLDQLDQRFPNNPYRDQIRKWRDKIMLDDAENRAKVLLSGVKVSFTDPKTNAERQFIVFHELADGASSRHDDPTAVRQWQELAKLLKADDPEERPWYLLALSRADKLEHDMADRRQSILKQFELAEAAYNSGRFDESATIKRKLVEQYTGYTDLADIFPPVQIVPPSEPKSQERNQPLGEAAAQPDSPDSTKPGASAQPDTEGPKSKSADRPAPPPPDPQPRNEPPES